MFEWNRFAGIDAMNYFSVTTGDCN
jgi:hypothetical protein